MADGMLGLAPLGLVPLGGIPDEFAHASTDPYAGVYEDPAVDLIFVIELERQPGEGS